MICSWGDAQAPNTGQSLAIRRHSGYGVEPHLQIIFAFSAFFVAKSFYTIYTFYTAKIYPCVTVTDYSARHQALSTRH